MKPLKWILGLLVMFAFSLTLSAISTNNDVGLLADQEVTQLMPGGMDCEVSITLLTLRVEGYTYNYTKHDIEKVQESPAILMETVKKIYYIDNLGTPNNITNKLNRPGSEVLSGLFLFSIQDRSSIYSVAKFAYNGSSLDCVNKLITKVMSTHN